MSLSSSEPFIGRLTRINIGIWLKFVLHLSSFSILISQLSSLCAVFIWFSELSVYYFINFYLVQFCALFPPDCICYIHHPDRADLDHPCLLLLLVSAPPLYIEAIISFLLYVSMVLNIWIHR